MRTSLEIVPKSSVELDAAVALVATRYPAIDTVNVPDRSNCELTSRAAAARIGGRIAHRIPHLRACDFDERSVIDLVPQLTALRIDEVIVIAGDRPDRDVPAGLEPVAMIRLLAERARDVAVYAALDPHRYLDAAALAHNIGAKLAAGARGFFTQPLFDLHDLDRCGALLRGATTFWGLSPVVSARSQRYWERVNGVRFPATFVPSWQWNHAFALRFLSEVAQRGGNAYLMPIKVDIDTYLAPLQRRFAAS